MPHLLHIDASPLDNSVTRELGREYLATWKSAHPDGTVTYRDLALETPSPVRQPWVYANFTPEDKRTPDQQAALGESDRLLDEVFAADEIVIGAPMHNFGIPASLKLWIDQVVRTGRTFRYGANGPEGLLKGKTATLLVASGGDYGANSPAAGYNFVEPYLRSVLGFLGVPVVRVYTVANVAKVMAGAVDRGTLLEPTLAQIRAHVA